MNKNVESFLKQFLDNNKENLPSIVKYFRLVSNEYTAMKQNYGVLSAVHSGYHTIDNILKDEFASNKSSCHDCKAAYCCHQPVTLCTDEVIAIIAYCKEMNIPIPKKYLKKQLKIKEKEWAISESSVCVFLKDNRCSIYPVRPSSCRTYHVKTLSKFCNAKEYINFNLVFYSSTKAEIIKMAMTSEGGKIDLMPQLILDNLRNQS